MFHRGIDQQRRIQIGLASAARPVPMFAVWHDLRVLDRIAAIGHRPKNGVSVVGIDIVIDRDDEFADDGLQGQRSVQRAPYFAARRTALKLKE